MWKICILTTSHVKNLYSCYKSLENPYQVQVMLCLNTQWSLHDKKIIIATAPSYISFVICCRWHCHCWHCHLCCALIRSNTDGKKLRIFWYIYYVCTCSLWSQAGLALYHQNQEMVSLASAISKMFWTYRCKCNKPCKNTVKDQLCMFIISLQKHLDYFNNIFRLSQLHQCDQGMLPNWKSFFSYISLRRPIWLHSCHFYHKPCNQGTQGIQMCVRSKQQQISPEMLIYKFSEKLYYFNKRGKHLSYTFKL